MRKKFKHHEPHIRLKARELLLAGLSLKRIENLTGVNRGTLSKVRSGEYHWPIKGDIEEIVFGGCEKGRCKTCGAIVYLPCVACGLKKP